MGTWGDGAFENDTACDWCYLLEKTDDLSLVEKTLMMVANQKEGLLDADVACEAVAACEVLARLKGNVGESSRYTEIADSWVAAHAQAPPASLFQLALRVVDRVSNADSELRQLWDEEGDDNWLNQMQELRRRLT